MNAIAGQDWLADGPPHAPTVLILPPLFDEANRMRRALRQAMRALASRGVASRLLDWPGQGESALHPETVTLAHFDAAVAQAAASLAGRPFLTASIRAGAAFDTAARGSVGWWRLAPIAPAAQLRTMERADALAAREAGRHAPRDAMLLAGWPIAPSLRAALAERAVGAPHPLRTVTAADLGGQPLWLRAEPGDDAALVAGMVADWTDWLARCDAI